MGLHVSYLTHGIQGIVYNILYILLHNFQAKSGHKSNNMSERGAQPENIKKTFLTHSFIVLMIEIHLHFTNIFTVNMGVRTPNCPLYWKLKLAI